MHPLRPAGGTKMNIAPTGITICLRVTFGGVSEYEDYIVASNLIEEIISQEEEDHEWLMCYTDEGYLNTKGEPAELGGDEPEPDALGFTIHVNTPTMNGFHQFVRDTQNHIADALKGVRRKMEQTRVKRQKDEKKAKKTQASARHPIHA